MHNKYPLLFSPLKINNNLIMKNRIEHGPLAIPHHAPGGYDTFENLMAVEQRARSGAALIVHPETMIDSSGNGHNLQFIMDNPLCVPSIAKEAELIHRYGGLASIELCHHGLITDPKFVGGKIYGPSEIYQHDFDIMVTPMDEDMIVHLVESFANAAFMAQYAGMDMVTIHAAHGMLLAQFLSPVLNKRHDKFGGSLENRARFSTMIIDAIKKKCGEDFPIEFRFSGDECIDGSYGIDEAKEYARLLESHGADLLNVSAGSFWDDDTSYRTFPSSFQDYGVNVYLAAEIKKAVNIPVATIGRLRNAEHMEEILEKGMADIVASSRKFWADPMWPKKAFSGQEDDITPCIYCNRCLSINYIPFVPFAMGIRQCTTNPTAGLERELRINPLPSKTEKTVLIIGGGPAGMQAAITSYDNGNKVILCEKEDSLGGNLKLMVGPKFKEDFADFLQLLRKRVDERDIDVRLNTTVTSELAAEINPDVIISAIGAKPILPAISGIEKQHVLTVQDIKTKPIGDNVVIIGGGAIGAELGLALSEQNKTVTVVEKGDVLAKNALYVQHVAIKNEYKRPYAPKVMFESICTKIDDNYVVILDKENNENKIKVDTVIIAVGMEAKVEESESFRELATYFRRIGDCNQARMLFNAIREGYDAGLTL